MSSSATSGARNQADRLLQNLFGPRNPGISALGGELPSATVKTVVMILVACGPRGFGGLRPGDVTSWKTWLSCQQVAVLKSVKDHG